LGVIGLIDETSVAKKGDKTPGVQRQYCGASGKIDNCIVSVHLGYSRPVGDGDWAVLLDADLYLPKVWAEDRERCRAAAIPEDMVCRPKPVMALEQVRRALANGVRFDWFVFDEAYGKDPSFLFGLDALGQTWIGEVPRNFRCWPTPPSCHSLRKEFASRQARNVVRWSPAFIYQAWQALSFPRQTVEPATWDVKAAQVHLVQDGRPTDRTYWLIVAWNRATDEHKYFASNAPPHTDLALLLRVAFQRAQVEHLFRVAKEEVGLTHFEGQSYVSLMRHMILCQLVLLFLAEQAQDLNAQRPTATPPPPALRGEKDPGPDPAGTVQDTHPRSPCDAGRDRPLPQLALYALA
jgi:SRSO17 transposase